MLRLVLALLVLGPSSRSGVRAGTHLDAPWFRWNQGIVPFYFQSMTNADRRVIRTAMDSIEQRTCLRFREQKGPLSGHHLKVAGSGTTCLAGPGNVPTFSATVGAVPPNKTQVLLQSYYQLADSPRCVNESRGGLLHELFHVFGVMHTQKRPDRDRHVRILKENIQDPWEYSYDICHECKDYGVPYDCDSIMHFGTETFSTGQPTMEGKDCNLKWVGAAFDGRHGSEVASRWDWELLRRIANRLCDSSSNTIESNNRIQKTNNNRDSVKSTTKASRRTTTKAFRTFSKRPPRRTTTKKPKKTKTHRQNSGKKVATRKKQLPAPWRRRPTSRPK